MAKFAIWNYWKKYFLLELGVGMATEGLEVRSVGNTMLLHETALIEACNLKFAIEYKLKNCKFILIIVKGI